MLGGYSGYVSLGHAAFFGIGAYAEAILFSHIDIGSSGYLPFLVLPAIGLGVALASVPIAWVAMRTRALTFAIVTLTLLFVVQTLAFNLRWLTNGSQGLSVPSPSFFPYERPYYLCVLGIFALATLVSWHVGRDKLGLVLLAIRDDEDKALGLGAHVSVAKVTAFGISVGLTAMVGGVWAYYLGFIYPQFAVDPLVTIGTDPRRLPGRIGHGVGTGARRVHPGSRAAVAGVRVRHQPGVPDRVRGRVPGHHHPAAAGHPSVDPGVPATPAERRRGRAAGARACRGARREPVARDRAAGGPRPDQALRRRDGGGRLLVRRAAWHDHGAHRPERVRARPRCSTW